jgi:hypothetical protein
MPSMAPPAASSRSGSASSSTALASVSAWSSGSVTRASPCVMFGTSNVNAQGPRAARSRTAASSAGVAAVRWATTRTREGAEDSMDTELLSSR